MSNNDNSDKNSDLLYYIYKRNEKHTEKYGSEDKQSIQNEIKWYTIAQECTKFFNIY